MNQKSTLLGGNLTKTPSFPDWPLYDENEQPALLDVLDSRIWWRTPGTKSLQFEIECHLITNNGFTLPCGTAFVLTEQ